MRLCGGRRRRNVKVTNPGERERERSGSDPFLSFFLSGFCLNSEFEIPSFKKGRLLLPLLLLLIYPLPLLDLLVPCAGSYGC